MNIRRHIPNAITSLNLLCGSIAVIFAIKGWISWSVLLILTASVFDFLDGFAARLLKAYSPMGKELDSLADMVSFGLAPSLILFTFYERALMAKEISATLAAILSVVPLIVAVASGLRLAKFNIDTRQSENFIGLPTPANAILIGSLIHFSIYNSSFDYITQSLLFIPIVSITLSYLLISEIPMFSMKLKSIALKGNELRYLFIVIIAILGVTTLLSDNNWSFWLLSSFTAYLFINIFSYFYPKRG